jgi:hypothetical protein
LVVEKVGYTGMTLRYEDSEDYGRCAVGDGMDVVVR